MGRKTLPEGETRGPWKGEKEGGKLVVAGICGPKRCQKEMSNKKKKCREKIIHPTIKYLQNSEERTIIEPSDCGGEGGDNENSAKKGEASLL